MAQPTTSSALPPSAALGQLVTGLWTTQALYLACELDLAGLLVDRPRTTADLAVQTDTHAPTLHRLLRALTSLDIIIEEVDGRFRLGELGAYLYKDHPQSVRSAALIFGGPECWNAWGNLLHGVRTGESAFTAAHGTDFFSYMTDHPTWAATFNTLMSSGGADRHASVAAAYDFSGVDLVVDVAGGNGGLLSAILQRNPTTRGILTDLPAGLLGASAALSAAGVAERCSVVESDFFDAVPTGGAIYLLSYILHDWDDDRAVAILRTCRRAMESGVRLLVADLVVPAERLSVRAAFQDLNMLALTQGGKERTEAQFRALFDAASLRLVRVIPTTSGIAVLEAIPIN